MIALSGCAKRNADRELARVLALIEQRVQSAKSLCAINALRALSDDLAAHAHRNLTPDLPPFEAARTR